MRAIGSTGNETRTVHADPQEADVVPAEQTVTTQRQARRTDLTMPRMDGREALHEIKRIRGDVPVVLSSGYNEADVAARFAGLGLAGFAQKPNSIEELMAVLDRALQPREPAPKQHPF